MKRLIILFFLLLNLNISARETIRITSGEWAPYLSEKLQAGGYGASIVTAAFDAVDIDVIYDYYPWKRSFEYAKRGNDQINTVNGTILWLKVPEREPYFYYTEPVIIDQQLMFSLKENPVEWDTLDDLIGKRIGLTLHTHYIWLENYTRKNELTVERVGGYERLFNRLLGGRIDCLPYETNVAEYYMRTKLTKEQREQIVAYPKSLVTVKFHVILSKAIPENKELVKKFNKGFEIIKNNGVYESIKEKFDKGYFDLPIK